MATHRHTDNPWRVRVDDADGQPVGAGVLLDDRTVLTCAHVVTQAGAAPDGPRSHLLVRSAVCSPEWQATARIAPENWVHRNGTRRGDVALLGLDEPAPCEGGARLWLAPISGGRVRAYGFPSNDPYGMEVDAELGRLCIQRLADVIHHALPFRRQKRREFLLGQFVANFGPENRAKLAFQIFLGSGADVHQERIDNPISGEGIDLKPPLIGGDHLLRRHLDVEDALVDPDELIDARDTEVDSGSRGPDRSAGFVLVEDGDRFAEANHHCLLGFRDDREAGVEHHQKEKTQNRGQNRAACNEVGH